MSAYEKQAFLHDPDNGVFGDCYRTCLAAMLGMPRDSVPHWVKTMEPALWESKVQPKYDKWLAKKGLQELAIPVQDAGLENILEWQNTRTRMPTIAMLTGQSGTGCNHVVLVSGGKIIHDPGQNDPGIIGPSGDGFYWVTWLIPLSASLLEQTT